MQTDVNSINIVIKVDNNLPDDNNTDCVGTCQVLNKFYFITGDILTILECSAGYNIKINK